MPSLHLLAFKSLRSSHPPMSPVLTSSCLATMTLFSRIHSSSFRRCFPILNTQPAFPFKLTISSVASPVRFPILQTNSESHPLSPQSVRLVTSSEALRNLRSSQTPPPSDQLSPQITPLSVLIPSRLILLRPDALTPSLLHRTTLPQPERRASTCSRRAALILVCWTKGLGTGGGKKDAWRGTMGGRSPASPTPEPGTVAATAAASAHRFMTDPGARPEQSGEPEVSGRIHAAEQPQPQNQRLPALGAAPGFCAGARVT